MDDKPNNTEAPLGEITFSGFHVVATGNNGAYATGLGRQNVRLHVSDGEGSSYVADVMLPRGLDSVGNFLNRLAAHFDTTRQGDALESLRTLQSAPDLQDKINLVVGSTWKEWKKSRNEEKRLSAGRNSAA